MAIVNLDALIINLDRAVRAVGGAAQGTGRAFPAQDLAQDELADDEMRHAAALMRVNHAGEIAAQALYHGQSLTARSPQVREALDRSAREEEDHLIWCRRRLRELHDSPSVLDALWYAGSFAIGAAAGLAGDRANLGFLAETEHQVEAHLADHLQRLPSADHRSRAVVEQMKLDEIEHAQTAERHGAAPMPLPVKKLMTVVSKVMTHTASRI